MTDRPLCEANSSSATQKIPSILWSPKVHDRIHNSPTLAPFLSHINPVPACLTCFLIIQFNFIFPSTPLSSKRSISFSPPPPITPSPEKCHILTSLSSSLYLITGSRGLPEKLTGPQLVRKFPALYGTRRFITAFTTASHLYLS